MSQFYSLCATLLLMTFVAGLVRVASGPTEVDRMLAAQLFGTTGVAILLLMAYATGQRPILDVALVFAVLAAIAVVAFVRRVHQAGERA